MTFRDLITNALTEINVSQGQTPQAQDLAWGLSKLNDQWDEWAARAIYVYNYQFVVSTLVPGLNPHLIGPTGTPTFILPRRPTKIESCSLIFQSAVQSDLPMNIRDDDWWANQRVKNLTTSVPTDLYYSQDNPNGSLFFWPIPNTAMQVRLEYGFPLSQVGLDDQVSLPQGYRKAVTLTLAESLCASFNKTPSQLLIRDAMMARKAVQGNNEGSPRSSTIDSGMPGKRTGGFNYVDGQLT